MDYFYVPPEQITVDAISIDGEEFSHLTHVMRKKPGDVIGIVDGIGNAYTGVIRTIVHRSAVCDIQSHSVFPGEPKTRLHLGVGILKNSSRFDYLVEKATELGADSITPLVTARTIPQHARTDRWQKIALAAMKQSCRSVLPRIGELSDLTDFFSQTAADPIRLIAHHEGGVNLLPQGSTSGRVVVAIGPEGGFRDDEVARASAEGFSRVSLGPLRLRTETAALVVAARILS